MMNTVRSVFTPALLFLMTFAGAAQQSPLVFPGGHGPGRGKHVVLIAGDQEYRSEESIPALAQILAARHGFHCTVLFSVNRQTGRIDPNTIDNIPGLEALRRADLVVLFARWLELPDEQMKEIVDYTDSGRPIVALRTSTHPFNYQKHPESPYAKYSYNNKQFSGGYGRQVLGETWIAHYGAHQKQSTRGVIAAGMEKHPILRGVRDLWGESDVYEITRALRRQPAARHGPGADGDGSGLAARSGQEAHAASRGPRPTPAVRANPSRIFTTTMGHVMDFRNQGFRRMMVNACYWAVGLEKKISAHAQCGVRRSLQSSPDRRTPRRAVNATQLQLSRRPLRHRARPRGHQRAQPVGEIARLRRTPSRRRGRAEMPPRTHRPRPPYPPPSPGNRGTPHDRSRCAPHSPAPRA